MADMNFVAGPAVSVLGGDYKFPNAIAGFPEKLSDFHDLHINFFKTRDDVRLAYWEAGKGKPLILIPGWSSNGAEYVNLMYLLSRHYRVYVLDVRNQGLSQRVDYGNRIARYAMDVKEFVENLGLEAASFCGWSMGAAILWAYIDLFGTDSIDKLAFIDQAASIYCHADWSEEERLEAGAFTSAPERMIASYMTMTPTNSLVSATRVPERAMQMDSLHYQNSTGFSRTVIDNDMSRMSQVLFDHATNDWRDVIRSKIDVPVAIFTGVASDWLQSQRWMGNVIPGATLHVYAEEDHGDHFLALKNPVKFVDDLRVFLED